MTPTSPSSPSCPSCSEALQPTGPGKILGGVPTAAEIELTRLPAAERQARAAAAASKGGALSREGPLRCASCGERLYRIGSTIWRHRGVQPVLTMAMAADRLRNHLRRRAIVRPGRIDGDCYLLPFVRFEGTTPEGDETFTLLAASIGEERLEAPFLPPADVRPFEPPAEGAAGSSGSGRALLRVQPPSINEDRLRARAEALGSKATRSVELIHFPFWLLRVEDRGRIEGAWMDGVEGKVIHHRFLLPAPSPSFRQIAPWTSAPAVVTAAAALAAPGAAIPLAIGAWAASIPMMHAAILRRWRG